MTHAAKSALARTLRALLLADPGGASLARRFA